MGLGMERKRIAVLLASIDREYQRNFAAALSAEAERIDADIFIFNCQGHSNHIIFTTDAGEGAVFDLPRMMSFDGIISLRETLANDVARLKVEELLQYYKGKPHVSIDVPTNGAVNILFDDSASVRALTSHLIEHHGVRDIVYISGPKRQIVAMNRLIACRETMEAHGLTLRPENVYDGEWIQRRGREIAMELLEREEGLPEAIVCGNDDMALGVIEMLHEQGKRVPEDVIVTGYDAIREAMLRELTTARRPIERAARTALAVLNHWIDGREPTKWDIFLPTIPLFRGTCGCEREKETLRERMWAMASERRSLEETLSKVSMFSGALASAKDEQDTYEKIGELARRWNVGEMYLCADPGITREIPERTQQETWPERMLLLYGRREGDSLPIQTFPTKDLIPVMHEKDRLPMCLVFSPLYYQDRILGYLAIENGDGIDTAMYSVLMLLNGALMSLYLQSNLRFYARRLEELTYTDPITGLLNRRGLMERAPLVMERARAEGKYFVLMSSDMDHMKMINDNYGHQAGDEAIRRMGRAMEKLRDEGMMPVHISGDEFQAYGMTEDRDAAGRIREALSRSLRQLNEEELWITEIHTSIGLCASVPREGMTLEDYQRTADRAMYEEKNRKKRENARSLPAS